jgi:hypothetical protein
LTRPVLSNNKFVAPEEKEEQEQEEQEKGQNKNKNCVRLVSHTVKSV